MKRKMIKKLLTGAMAVVMMSSLIACGQTETPATPATEPAAEESSEEVEETEAVAEESGEEDAVKGSMEGVTLKIGTDVSFVPFEFPDESDTYVGFDMDLIKALSDYLGFEYELTPMDFTAMLMSVQTSKLDVGIAGITMTDEREDVMDFSDPYYDAGIQILVKEDSDIAKFDDLHGKKLAVKEGTASLTYCEENFSDSDIITFATIDEAYLEVQRGAADATVFDAPNMLYFVKTNPECGCKVVGELMDACQYGILFPAESENKALFDAALAKFKEDGTYDTIYNTWFGN